MRIIPVIDLLKGQAVHAIKGDRAHYQPLQSTLCTTPDPLEVAKAFRDKLGLKELYVADLDAIQNGAEACQKKVISDLTALDGLTIMLDAGVSNATSTSALFDLGVNKVIVGAETLRDASILREMPKKFDSDRLVFSLDMRAGKILSLCPELCTIDALRVLEIVKNAGWREIILLDLARVGTRDGADYELLAEASLLFPGLSLLIGGGVSNTKQLVQLQSAGAAGILLATALHLGTIQPAEIALFH
jgi:phosphoribosylformimino-5-aminoimidazole carboxamide ribotide isomerase